MILDIRDELEGEIDGVRFDESSDVIRWGELYVSIAHKDDDEVKTLCLWKDLDNFIAALLKAKELAGK